MTRLTEKSKIFLFDRCERRKTMETMGRCMKCKKSVTIKDGEEVTMKNSRKMLKGICPECGTVVCRILGKDK